MCRTGEPNTRERCRWPGSVVCAWSWWVAGSLARRRQRSCRSAACTWICWRRASASAGVSGPSTTPTPDCTSKPVASSSTPTSGRSARWPGRCTCRSRGCCRRFGLALDLAGRSACAAPPERPGGQSPVTSLRRWPRIGTPATRRSRRPAAALPPGRSPTRSPARPRPRRRWRGRCAASTSPSPRICRRWSPSRNWSRGARQHRRCSGSVAAPTGWCRPWRRACAAASSLAASSAECGRPDRACASSSTTRARPRRCAPTTS